MEDSLWREFLDVSDGSQTSLEAFKCIYESAKSWPLSLSDDDSKLFSRGLYIALFHRFLLVLLTLYTKNHIFPIQCALFSEHMLKLPFLRRGLFHLPPYHTSSLLLRLPCHLPLGKASPTNRFILRMRLPHLPKQEAAPSTRKYSPMLPQRLPLGLRSLPQIPRHLILPPPLAATILLQHPTHLLAHPPLRRTSFHPPAIRCPPRPQAPRQTHPARPMQRVDFYTHAATNPWLVGPPSRLTYRATTPLRHPTRFLAHSPLRRTSFHPAIRYLPHPQMPLRQTRPVRPMKLKRADVYGRAVASPGLLSLPSQLIRHQPTHLISRLSCQRMSPHPGTRSLLFSPNLKPLRQTLPICKTKLADLYARAVASPRPPNWPSRPLQSAALR